MEWHLSRMFSNQGACLPTECTEMWNIFTGFGMKVDIFPSTSWLMSCAAFWFMASDFDTRLSLWQIVSKFLPCVLLDEQKQLELHQCVPGQSEDMSDIHISFKRSLQMTRGISLSDVGREVCSFVKCLLMLVLMCKESCVMRLFGRNRLNQHFLQMFDDVYGKMCVENNLKNVCDHFLPHPFQFIMHQPVIVGWWILILTQFNGYSLLILYTMSCHIGRLVSGKFWPQAVHDSSGDGNVCHVQMKNVYIAGWWSCAVGTLLLPH